jgi:hypothetical protein
MKKFSTFIKLFILAAAASLMLCSCEAVADAASSIAGAALSSAQAEISSVISEGISGFSEGLGEFSDEMGEIRSAASEVSDNIQSAITSVSDLVSDQLSSARDVVSEQLGSAAESISGEISSNIADAVGSIIPETTADTTAPAASEKNAKWYTFRNKTRYNEHYENHGAEFGNITKDEYLQLANDLINNKSDRVLHKYSEDGDYMYFDQDTGYFLVLSEDGYIRTFFVPNKGIDYWNRQ